MHPESLAEMERILAGWTEPGPVNLLDVGSLDINGSYRSLVERRGWRYTGLDLVAGPNVDVAATDEYRYPFADGAFDIVISGSTAEHVAMPWRWIPELARLLRPNGLLAIITHTQWPEHRFPRDYWRFLPDAFHLLFTLAGNLHSYDIRCYCPTDISATARKR